MASLFRRKLIRFLLLLILLVVALTVTARLLIPTDRIRDLLVTKLEAATGAQVSLGQATVGFWPRLRVVVKDGEIKGTGRALEQAARIESNLQSYEVTLDRLEIDLAIGPLLRKRIETGKIRLVAPEIDVVTKNPEPPPGGPTTGSTVLPGSGAPPVPSGGSSPAVEPSPQMVMPWELVVAGIEVRNGSVRWRQARTEKAITITGWEQEITIGDMNLLLQRLLAFRTGEPEADPAPETSRLQVQTNLGQLTVAGFSEGPPTTFTDISARGALVAEPAADHLGIQVDAITWRSLELAADLELSRPDRMGFARLSGTWRSGTMPLAALVQDCQELAPPPAAAEAATDPDPVQQWLTAGPVSAGELTLGGQLSLPWPTPPQSSPLELLQGVTMAGSLTAGRCQLPGGEAILDLELRLELVRNVLSLVDIELTEPGGGLAVNGRLDLPLDNQHGTLTGALAGSGNLGQLQALGLSVSAALAPAGEPATPPRLAGSLRWRLDLELAETPAWQDQEAWRQLLESGQLSGVALQGSLTDLQVTGIPGEPWDLGQISFDSDGRQATVSCQGVQHSALSGGVTARVTQFFPEPLLELDLQVERLDVDQLVTLFGDPDQVVQRPPTRWPLRFLNELVAVAYAAAPATEAAIPPGERIPESLTVSYAGRVGTVIMHNARYDDVLAQGSLQRRRLIFASVTARQDTGTITGHGAIDYAVDPHGELSFEAEATEVPVGALVTPYAPAIGPLWEGVVTAKASGGCRLKDKASVLSSLSLGGDALASNGVIRANSLLDGISQYLGDRQDLKLIKFKRFLHNFEVRDGRYHIKDLELHGPDTDWWGDGWLGFDGGIDLVLQVKLPADFTPQLGAFSFLAAAMRGEDERIKLDLRLSGRSARPRVTLDLEEAKALLQEQAGDDLQDTVKEGLKGLLDKLKGN
ncbi:MAG: AsmA-like C-terminal region-containing protein [bacterium]